MNEIIIIISIMIITLFLEYMIKKKWKVLFNKTTLIKKYWKFVISFLTISIISGIIVYLYTENTTTNLMLLTQVLTLIFAIFVGYFAFQQVSENRLDRLKEQGHLHLRRLEYLRAIKSFEEAFLASPKNFNILANLQECYIIVQDTKNFNEKKELIEKIIIEDREKIIFYYLKSTDYLIKQDLGKAKEELAECIKFIGSSNLLLLSGWNFSDITKSDSYKNLSGESKKILDNLISYLQGILSGNEKKEFESGNYALDKPENKEN